MGGGRIWKDRALTWLLLLAVRPLRDGEVDLLAGRGLGLEGLLEAVPHQRGADVGVANVGHPRRAPEGHRCCRRRHRVFSRRRRRWVGGWRWERWERCERGVPCVQCAGHWAGAATYAPDRSRHGLDQTGFWPMNGVE
jgi:hypothetical protein